MNKISASIKHAASTLGALVVIGAAFSALIAAFGGRIPPFITVAEGQIIQQQLTQQTEAINQLALIVLARMAVEARQRAMANPGDTGAEIEAKMWEQKLAAAIAAEQAKSR